MPRFRRVNIPGHPHHVTHRGNRKASIFLDESDHYVYMKLLFEQCIKHLVRIWAYSLMDNHVHLIAVPTQEESLGRLLQRVHGDYAGYFNLKHSKVGHLWQGRYNATVLDERHLWNAVRYVERNPVRAGLKLRAQDFQWSSAAAHCGLRTDRLLSDDLPLLAYVTDWSAWLAEEEQQNDLKIIREKTRTGRPCADADFIQSMEKQLGRTLFPQRTGPKRKFDRSENREIQLLFPEELGD